MKFFERKQPNKIEDPKLQEGTQPQEINESKNFTEKITENQELSIEDISKIQEITTNTDVVPEEIRGMARPDILDTIQNNHPLNKVWRDERGEITGYLAFEDFKAKEAYVTYFSTNGQTRESVFAFIPKLIDKAKSLGYQKIGFHGFNNRLNKVSSRFGFERQRTDTIAGFSADYYEFDLNKTDDSEKAKQQMIEAFQAKALEKISESIEIIKNTLNQDKLNKLKQAHQEIINNLAELDLTKSQKLILELKLARYLQREDSVDVNTLSDAISETPRFLDKPKGGLHRLLEIHEQKTLEKIAEIRRQKAEQTGDEEFNPYEALFQTSSGDYYMARLLNMPHLEEESSYMNHCVGTSDSYINKMKKGDTEILSFRNTDNHEPIMTIEYNVRTKTIEQIKKASDKYLKPDDPYYNEFLEALGKLKTTQHNNGQERNFQHINESELKQIPVQDYHVITDKGEVHYKDLNLTENPFILKIGEMSFDSDTPKEDAAKMIEIFTGLKYTPDQIATSQNEVNENTKIYNGELYPNIFKELPDSIEKIYTNFPEKISEVYIKEIEIPNEPKTADEYITDLEKDGHTVTSWAKNILPKANLKEGAGQKKRVIIPSNKSLGFPNGATRAESKQKAQELGIATETLPAIIGPELRKQYIDQPSGECILVDTDSILDRDGVPLVFRVFRDGTGSRLSASGGELGVRWNVSVRWAFSQI
jgi:hypothetical protein